MLFDLRCLAAFLRRPPGVAECAGRAPDDRAFKEFDVLIGRLVCFHVDEENHSGSFGSFSDSRLILAAPVACELPY